MEVFYIYLIKSSGLIALFYLTYHFMLRKETFFTSNRWFLLLGLFTSILLPLVVFTKTIWVEPTPVNYDWSSLPISTIIDEDHTQEYIYLALAVLYCIGTLCLFTKFGFEFYSLQKIVKGKTIKRQANFKFIDLKDNLAPFSYFNTIVYNSSLYSSSELENILEHEKVHSEQNHTVDVLISRLFCIVFWFNPFIWFYKKAIIQNLEFIADSEATKKISDKKAYQLTLLKITTHENCVAITNHFYQSLIKKRIVMLNKNQSKKSNSWKYTLVLPVLVAFVFLFQIDVIAQEKVKEETIKVESKHPVTAALEIQQEKDSIKKAKVLIVSSSKNDSIDKNTEIFIDGKKVSKEELDRTNPNDITTMDVVKENNKSIIRIVTKGKTAKSTNIFNSNTQVTDLRLENVNPNSLKILQKPKTTYTVTKITTEKNGIPDDAEYFIDGKKVSPLEAESMNPNYISSVNIQKDGTSAKNSIRIITKSYLDGKEMIPEPPTPPAAPTFKSKAAKGDPVKKDNKGWEINFGTFAPEDNIKRIQNDKNVNYKEAVIVINGKISDYQALDKLKPEDIFSVGAQKPSNGPESTKQNALKKYGEKALNGIIEIETKEFQKK
ncbi:M56 family metallopeptidase [Flavobacterium sp. LB2P53]|uniref:M56 family metallopeptidase n=1 Tax=Flavobacterium sp. LB2P53 TaxID=2497481 RepID=UPI000F845596|nr:M56 family metallopeptidase [Flavobacterium sp. LB2P53]RTY69577.1 M56 family metallopeptidase [Flavobacterium sp. LB2P53]